MRKNIISQSLSKVNDRIEKAESRLDYAVGRVAIADARERLTPMLSIKDVLMSLIEATPRFVGEFKWECEGGLALDTSKLLPSAMWTAYASLTHGYFVENDLYDRDNGKPLFDFTSFLGSREEYGVDEFVAEDNMTFIERLRAAQAVFIRTGHVAHFKDGEFRWLLSMDVNVDDPKGGPAEKQTIHICMPYLHWCIQRQQECEPNSKQFHRYAKLIADLQKEDFFLKDLPDVDAAGKLMRAWLHTPCDDGTYESRHERIVTRVAERRYGDLIDSIEGLDFKETLKAAKPWELVLSAPNFGVDHRNFIASDEWQATLRIQRLQKLEKMADKADELDAQKARNESLDKAEYALLVRLGMPIPEHLAYLAVAPVAQPQSPASQAVSVTITQLSNPTLAVQPSTPVPLKGIAGTQAYSLNVKGPRGYT